MSGNAFQHLLHMIPVVMGIKFKAVPPDVKQLRLARIAVQEALGKKLGREPCITEVAAEMQVEPEELIQAFEATGELESLHKPIYRKDGQELTLADKLASPTEGTEEVLDHMLLKELLASLNKEERRLIYLRYFAERTQSQVGEEHIKKYAGTDLTGISVNIFSGTIHTNHRKKVKVWMKPERSSGYA